MTSHQVAPTFPQGISLRLMHFAARDFALSMEDGLPQSTISGLTKYTGSSLKDNTVLVDHVDITK